MRIHKDKPEMTAQLAEQNTLAGTMTLLQNAAWDATRTDLKR